MQHRINCSLKICFMSIYIKKSALILKKDTKNSSVSAKNGYTEGKILNSIFYIFLRRDEILYIYGKTNTPKIGPV